MALEDFYREQIVIINEALAVVYGDQWIFDHVPVQPQEPFGRKKSPVRVYIRDLYPRKPVLKYYFNIGAAPHPVFEIKASEALVKEILRGRENYSRKTKAV